MSATPALSLSPHAPRTALPRIIQGGMGVGVSGWEIASAVSRSGQLGVVAGTALDLVLARGLQNGDKDGSLRRALAAFPVPDAAARIQKTFFHEGGLGEGVPYRPATKFAPQPSPESQELAIVGNFVAIWLAKEGHDGVVGVNYLEKIQLATPAAAYGAMLAGVDFVLMGAGLPRDIPHLLNELAQHHRVELPLDVHGAPAGNHTVVLDPADTFPTPPPPLKRPQFLAIISAHVLATYLARDDHMRPDGFVVEGPTAGGHNAPPRDKRPLAERGGELFGPRDVADVAKVADVGLPFWVAGGYGTPEGLRAALDLGAQGVQVGTLFALSRDSGLTAEIRDETVAKIRTGTLRVETDVRASPTGFPFKVAHLDGTLTDPGAVDARTRVCDLGYLGVPYLATQRNGGPTLPVRARRRLPAQGRHARRNRWSRVSV